MTAIASYHDKTEWLKERQSGIGGSDASVILGVNPFKTPLQLWEEKTAETPTEIPVTPAMKRGTVLEPVAADLYAEETGRDIRRQPLKRSSEYEFMLGNVDRQILATGDVSTTGALEIKCPGLKVMAKVKAHGLQDYMTVQLMHYLGVYGYEWGSFCLFNAENWEVIHFDLEADEEFIGELIEREHLFWNEHVLAGVAPEDTLASSIDIPEVEGELKVIDGTEWRKAAKELKEARELLSAANELSNAASGTLKGMMEDNDLDAIEIPDLVKIYYRQQAGRTSWKGTAEAIAKEAELDVSDFLKIGKPSRAFRPYFLIPEEE